MKLPSVRLAVVVSLVGIGLGTWNIATGSSPMDNLELSQPDLRALYDAHEWFRLRDAIAGREVASLYRGAVAAAFNRVDEAAEALQPLISSPLDSKDADDADDWLSYMFVRSGQYQRAAMQMGSDDGTPLLGLLRSLPDQVVSKTAPSSIACRLYEQRLFLPMTVGGTAVEFFVDSDANFSFMSESEAKSLSLIVRESSLKVHGVSGLETAFRTAVVDRLTVGNVELRHVTFLVMPENSEIFARLKKNQQGAIGLPVLVAFRNLHYQQGTVEIANRLSVVRLGEQNLCFDGLDPVTQVSFQQHELPFVLDTGAPQSEAWPVFARQFTTAFTSRGKMETVVENGFGGKLLIPAKTLPELTFAWGGGSLQLRALRALLQPTTPNSQRYAGRLGLDALTFPHEINIDFEHLKLTAN